MLSLNKLKAPMQRLLHRSGKHRVPILVPLAGPDYDLVSGEINKLHP